MRIVTDGELYAVEKGWIFKKYASMYTPGRWWTLKKSHEFCWGRKTEIQELFRTLNRKKRIKEVEENSC